MDFRQIKKYLPYVWSGLPALAGILLFIFGMINSHTLTKVLMLICSFLMIVLAGLIYVYFFIFGEVRKNYFLTNEETGKSIRADKLTFGMINDRMNFFMAQRINEEQELWLGGFLGKRGIFGPRDMFKPLAVYKMLFDLSERNSRNGWAQFYLMPDSDFARMINCLDAADDLNMSRKLTSLRRINDGTQIDRLSDFVIRNRKYIQSKMLSYVRLHISDFDEPEKQ